MEVLDTVGLGGKYMEVVRKRGGRRYGCYEGLIDALEVHIVEYAVGVASALQGSVRAD